MRRTTIADYQKNHQILSEREHADCFVCGKNNTAGLQLNFTADDEGAVFAEFPCAEMYQGYPKWLHGGITSTLLDGAMANCLFANGAVGATGELSIRFRSSVEISSPVIVKAWLTKVRAPLFLIDAQLLQNGRIIVTATGKFIGEQVDLTPYT